MANKKKKNNSAQRLALVTVSQPATAGSVKSKGAKRRARQRSGGAGTQMMVAPMAIGKVVRSGDPSIRSNNKVCVVSHREYLFDTLSYNDGAFRVLKFLPLNPGVETSFPWLSALAQRYESYRFLSLKVVYAPFCASTHVGSIGLAIDFDAADPAPTTKAQMMSYHKAVRGPLWSNLELICPASDLNRIGSKFTRHRAPAANMDIKTYDIGNLIVSSSDSTISSGTGELYLEYTVELTTPQMIGDEEIDESIRVSSGAGASTLAPFNGATTTGYLPISVAADSLTFNEVGEYLVNLRAVGTALAAAFPNLTGTAAAWKNGGSVTANTTLTNAVENIQVKVTQPGQYVTFDYSAVATTLTFLAANISRYAYSLSS